MTDQDAFKPLLPRCSGCEGAGTQTVTILCPTCGGSRVDANAALEAEPESQMTLGESN